MLKTTQYYKFLLKKVQNLKTKEIEDDNKQLKTAKIVNPQKFLQPINQYCFKEGFSLIIHQTSGFYAGLQNFKKISYVTYDCELKVLKIVFNQICYDYTPFEFFEERMKSLGDIRALNYCQIIGKILKGANNDDQKIEININNNVEENNKIILKKCDTITKKEIQIQKENYEKFKKLIKEKIRKDNKNNKTFLVFINGSNEVCEHYISDKLLEILYEGDQNYLFDIMRKGVPDFYRIEGDFFENQTKLFKSMLFDDHNNIEIYVKAGKKKVYYDFSCETLSYDFDGYSERAYFQYLKKKKETKKIENNESIKIEKFDHAYLYEEEVQEFKNQFYSEKTPLNERKDNFQKICSYKKIKI